MCSADLMNSMIYCDIVYLYCCRGAFVNEDSTHHHPQAIYQTISKVPACVEESLREVLHISDDIFGAAPSHQQTQCSSMRGKVQSNESSKPPNKCNPNKLHPPMEQSVTIVITQMENLKKHISGADES